jgi:hypothetical protein
VIDIDASRHIPLRRGRWDCDQVRSEIADIIADALAHFDRERFWPAHPLDHARDGNSSIYLGAAGVIWALAYLQRQGATGRNYDFRSSLPRLLNAARADMGDYAEYSELGSLLLGDLGAALLIMRLSPTSEVADLVAARAEGNTHLPVRELMWGMPGSMLACLHMAQMTGEARWIRLFQTQALRLLDELTDTADGPLWVQDLYGGQAKYLGPVHGYAGNMIPLLRGWQWLSASQQSRVAAAVPNTLKANASRADAGATWPAIAADHGPLRLCQYCHGAPGIVTTFADAPFSSREFEDLLLAGGNFTWSAGPLAKGSSLCHGTGGNGYAFLKLYRRTGDAVWLERARAFAVTAIAQCREARNSLGRGRYSLWTGDLGLAVYLFDCLTAVPRFPTIDVF